MGILIPNCLKEILHPIKFQKNKFSRIMLKMPWLITIVRVRKSTWLVSWKLLIVKEIFQCCQRMKLFTWKLFWRRGLRSGRILQLWQISTGIVNLLLECSQGRWLILKTRRFLRKISKQEMKVQKWWFTERVVSTVQRMMQQKYSNSFQSFYLMRMSLKGLRNAKNYQMMTWKSSKRGNN